MFICGTLSCSFFPPVPGQSSTDADISQYLKWTGLLEYERRCVFLLVRCSWRVRIAGTSHDERIRSGFVASGVLHRVKLVSYFRVMSPASLFSVVARRLEEPSSLFPTPRIVTILEKR